MLCSLLFSPYQADCEMVQRIIKNVGCFKRCLFCVVDDISSLHPDITFAILEFVLVPPDVTYPTQVSFQAPMTEIYINN